MNLEMQVNSAEHTQALQAYIRRRVIFHLRRIIHSVSKVVVCVTGCAICYGRPQACRIHIASPICAPLSAHEANIDVHVAIDAGFEKSEDRCRVS